MIVLEQDATIMLEQDTGIMLEPQTADRCASNSENVLKKQRKSAQAEK